MVNKRPFRTYESIHEERKTRKLVTEFLKRHRFRVARDERVAHGTVESQTIYATTPAGQSIVMRVRLCWRPRREHTGQRMAASQLLARVEKEDWEGTISAKVNRQRSEGVTHLLLVKRVGKSFPFGALIPLDEVLPIWRAQRDVSSALISRGDLGRRTKNHAMNGSSPTLWLADHEAPSVAAALWNHPGVVSLSDNARDSISLMGSGAADDTYDDLPAIDARELGTDAPVRHFRLRSYVSRDPRVREEVRRLAGGRCERPKCGETRTYPGFLDVHHVLGAAKSDRVTNCVAICPNCHREAHFAPDRDEINAELLSVAKRHIRATRRPPRRV